LTHLRYRLPRLLITTGCWRAGGGEQVQQGLFGDADTAADADRTQLAARDRLVELVAPHPQDRRGLADGEHLGQRGQCAGGRAGQVQRRRGGGGWWGRRRALPTIGSRWPLLLLGRWCCAGGGRSALPAAAAGVTIPRPRAQVWGVLPGGRAHRAVVDLGDEGERSGGRESAGRVVVIGELCRICRPRWAGSRACSCRPRR
jgi:hypothetical protein